MKFNRTILVVAISSAMVLSLAACSHSGGEGQSSAPAAAATAPAAAPAATAPAPAPAATAASGSTSAAAPASASSIATLVAHNQAAGDNWFGGPVYSGKPDLAATAALVKAGGGADNFDFSKALVAMLGQDTVNKEVDKLNKQYGDAQVKTFLSGMNVVVQDALKQATAQGIKLPPPAKLSGEKLAVGLVKLGTAPDGTFWSGYLFDHAVSHDIHNKVMADIDAKQGMDVDATTHRILNQAMYDVAQATGHKDVKLASFH